MAAIPFVFYAVLSSILLQANAQSNITCSPSVTSYCTSCRTQAICSVDGTSYTNSTCIGGQVCNYNAGFAVCTDPANVPGCKCNSSGSSITYQCDPYAGDRTIVCYKGAIQSGTICTNPDVCIPATGKCGQIPPTTPTPTAPSTTTPSVPVTCAPDSEFLNKQSCTTFYFCSPGEYPNYQECDPGQIYSNKVNDCLNYTSTFTCPTSNGVFADPFNCSLIHTCNNSADSISLCPPGQFYDEEGRACTADGNCTTEQCTPCKSAADVFPVNETACVKEYKQCTVVNNQASDNFTIIVRMCPGTFVYDPIKKGCTSKCSLFRNSWLPLG